MIIDNNLKFGGYFEFLNFIVKAVKKDSYTHTHNRFTALLESVRDYPGEQVPER